MKIKTVTLIVLACTAVAILSGCADSNTLTGQVRPDMVVPANFWHGWWHGVCAPFSFIGIMFGQDVGIYEAYNNGNWYNFGFLIGVGCLGGITIRVRK